MILDDFPGYYSHRTIPARPGSKQAYIMQPLDVRRHHRLYASDDNWTLGLELMVMRKTAAYSEVYTFAREKMRKEFVFKVYGLLSCQLLYVLINLLVFFSIDGIQEFLNKYLWIIWVILGCAFVVYALLLCSKKLRKTSLLNFILITLLVFLLAKGISAATCVFQLYVFIYGFSIQTSIVLFITLLARFGPCNVAGCAMIFCVISVVFCIYGVIASLILLLTGFRLLDLVLAGIAVIIASLYLMFDTQVIMDDKSLDIAPQEFVKGNIQLYVDVILLFLRLCLRGIKKTSDTFNLPELLRTSPTSIAPTITTTTSK